MSKILAFIQQLVTADRAAITAGLVSVLTLLAAKFGLKLNASDTAYLAAILAGLVAAFTHVHFAAKAPAAPGEHEKP